jgi:hypothetical protein
MSRNEVESTWSTCHLVTPLVSRTTSDKMSEFYPKPTHGTAFKTVMEESQIMDQFMGIVHKK